MSAAAAPTLYTREMLALALELAAAPLDPVAPLQGEARSRACGSIVKLSARCDGEGGLADIGLTASSCAVGQAAAALFLRGAEGLGEGAIRQAAAAIEGWLANGGSLPAWPAGLDAIAAARAYPSRHGAVLLPWRAALDALSSGSPAR